MSDEIVFVNGKSKCGCVMEYSDGGGEYSDVHRITPCNKHAHNNELKATEAQIAELKDENEYIRKRFKELDRMFGKNLLVMQAAIIEWRTTGDAKNGMAWIFNTLLGPGELPSEDEKDAQAYFDREYAPIDKELMELYDWFHEYHKRFKEKQVKENG